MNKLHPQQADNKRSEEPNGKRKAWELVIMSTDKSGKRAVMSKDIYIKSMQPHIEGDSIHTRDEVDLMEGRFNGAAAQILKSFGWGEDWGHQARFKSAYSASFNQVRSLNQTLKDHKPPPQIATRQICRDKSDQSTNGPLADLMCELLDPFVQEADREDRTEIISTEELCHEVEKTNSRTARVGIRRGPFQADGELTAGSMDADKFYPNLDIDQTAEEVKLEILESKVELQGAKMDEVALFLACSMTQKEIDNEGLTHVVNRRRFNKGTRPGLTCPAITGGPKVRDEDTSWLPPLRQPTATEATLMVGCLVKCGVKLVMKNHLTTRSENREKEEQLVTRSLKS